MSEIPISILLPLAFLVAVLFWDAVFGECIEGAEEHRRWVEEVNRKER